MIYFYYFPPEVLDFTLENRGVTEYDTDREANLQRAVVTKYFGDSVYTVLRSYDNIRMSYNSPCLVYGYKFQIFEESSIREEEILEELL